jgi:trimeric autotransporter adhesin
LGVVKRLLFLIVPIALAGCGADDPYYPGPAPSPATYANVQFLNSAFFAPPLDVLIDGKVWVRHLDYGRGTAELSIVPGSHTLIIQIETPGTATTVYGPATLDAVADMDYVIGVGDFGGDAQSPTATISTYPHQLAVVPPQSARIQLLNIMNDGGSPIALYVTAPGADLSTSTPLGTASYQGSIGPIEVPAGQSEIRLAEVNATGSQDVTVFYDSGAISLAGGTDLVLSRTNVELLYCPPGAMCPVPSPILSAVDALGNNTMLPMYGGIGGGLRVVHDSPDAPALGVTVNGNLTSPLLAQLTYEGDTPYDLKLAQGIDRLAVSPAANLNSVLASSAVGVEPFSAHTLYMIGPFAQLSALVTHDDYRRYSTQARLRFIQGSAAANTVDVYLTAPGAGIATATPTYAAVPFAADTGFVSYVQGGYDLTVTAAGSKTPIIGPIGAFLEDGEITTLVMREAPGGGAPYGLIQLDDPLAPASFGQ